MVWEAVLEEVPFPVTTLPIPKKVIVPSVVVRVVEPLVTVETTTEVLIADEDTLLVTVCVEEYEMYDPVGVASSEVPVKTMTLEELEELESWAFVAMAKRPSGIRCEKSMIAVLILCLDGQHPTASSPE